MSKNNTFAIKDAADLSTGDFVLGVFSNEEVSDQRRSFEVLSDAEPFEHFLLSNQVRVRGCKDGREGWVEFGAQAKIAVRSV